MSRIVELFSVALSGKLFSLVIFALLARMLDANYLAFVGLIPALSGLVLSVFGFGVGTLLEREIPKLLRTDSEDAHAHMRSGFLAYLGGILAFLLVSKFLLERLAPLLLGSYSYDPTTIWLIMFPICAHVLNHIVGLMLLLTGRSTLYGVVSIYTDLLSKLVIIAIYSLYPSELSVFIGLTSGPLLFVGVGLWMHRSWLFHGPIYPISDLLKHSRIFHLESVFNALRNRGDSLLVSTFLGPIAMANFYVAKTIAFQLNVFFQPLGFVIVHTFSDKLGAGQAALRATVRRVWSVAPALYIWLSCGLAAITPLLIKIVAGPEYMESWPTAVILSFVMSATAIYAIASRVLLLMGRSIERFRMNIFHVLFIIALLLYSRSYVSPESIAAIWLLATIATSFLVVLRVRQIAFKWPSSRALIRATFFSIPTPVIALYFIGYGSQPIVQYVLYVVLLSVVSLTLMIRFQSPYESKQLRDFLPRLVHPLYDFIALR